jgi:transposase
MAVRKKSRKQARDFCPTTRKGTHSIGFRGGSRSSFTRRLQLSGVTSLVGRPRHRRIEALSAEMTRRLAALNRDASFAESPGPRGEASTAATLEAGGTSMTFARAVTLLDTIPGVNQRGGELLVAERGIAMGCFGTAARLAVWSGVAPDNDESAGKHRSGKTHQGTQALRTGLTQLAHAAARTKGTDRSALDHLLAARRGKKRAIIAVAHSFLVSAVHRRIRDAPNRELEGHDCDTCRQAPLVDQLTRRIERLGYRVPLDPVAAT